MHKELELWQFIAARLKRGENALLLVVAESSGSSPGREGYKMAVAEDGELTGSIGGGVMEVNLVEESRNLLSVRPEAAGGFREQIHRKDVEHASGMICSGKQTVIFRRLSEPDFLVVRKVIDALENRKLRVLKISSGQFGISEDFNPHATAGIADKSDPPGPASRTDFSVSGSDFNYQERLGPKNDLYVVGGGHCALAVCELMSKMDFYISLFDDRPDLNTIEKNEYAHVIKIVDSYDRIGDHIPSGVNAFVVVMTIGYKTDEIVIRGLLDKEFKYFGVLGSKAKMSTMFKSLREDGIPDKKLSKIHTPVGLPINSRTPEEIAVSIAAEIISVKNGNI